MAAHGTIFHSIMSTWTRESESKRERETHSQTVIERTLHTEAAVLRKNKRDREGAQ